MWITPHRIDLEPVIGDLGLDGHLKIFTGRAERPTDVPRMIRDAFPLDELAAGYRAFLDRWDHPGPVPEARDDLARYVWMCTEWLQLGREEPRLPVEYLPAGWPAARAQDVLLKLRARYEEPARDLARQAIESIPVPPEG